MWGRRRGILVVGVIFNGVFCVFRFLKDRVILECFVFCLLFLVFLCFKLDLNYRDSF